MMHACGGVGYKKELGIERLLRDGKAGWMMGASNEVLRQLVGKTSLLGLGAVDLWLKIPDRRVLNSEIRKLSGEAKRDLARKLLIEADNDDAALNHNSKLQDSYQDSEFENPFNTKPPAVLKPLDTPDGVAHEPCLRPDRFTALKLLSVKSFGEMIAEYTFSLPQPTDCTGCFPGQYVRVRIGKNERFFSPVSRTKEFGKISLLLKHETHGVFSNSIRSLQLGETVDFCGPCGGYEYQSNSTKYLTLLVGGMSCQPAVQIVREIMANPKDHTIVSLLLCAAKPADIPYRQELQKYTLLDKRVKTSFTVCEVDCDDWEGGEGYIDANLLSNALPSPEESSHRVLVSGGPRLVMGVLQGLRVLGYSSEKIFVYGQFGVQQIRAVYGKYAKLAQHRENHIINGYC
ncbi:NADH-cytochrome b5 reductase 1-like [Orbicella faveolata]|uniref:NADH-cytochrome b5 reductase 1-like n=1 Tax=Orbicella faveolata TaxID=48498 RepID=UPI0009E33D3A|nr:NADH-cytochrome b5 reductase 1-like [Orbicella faveolata]